MLYQFNGYTLDLKQGCLRTADREIELRPKCFDILRFLLESNNRLISKEELLAAAWSQAVVTDEALARCISDVRAAIDDHGHQIIKTVPRRGYLFTAVVTRHEDAEPQQRLSAAVVETENERSVADLPSIAVLAFTNMSGDLEQEYFSDGITEDIITELSRFSELLVIARNSSFRYKGQPVDVRRVGREIGARYVLEGSVRRAGDRIRISAQLIDATIGAHRWAERYDRDVKDVFAVQDEISRTVASILASHVNKAEIERVLLKPPTSWHAYDFYLRASELYNSFHSSFKVNDLYEARRLLQHSISADPTYSRACALLSNTHITSYLQPLDKDHLDRSALDRALSLGRKALQLDSNLPQAHGNLGHVLTFLCEHDAAIAEHEKALELNPNYSDWRFGTALVRGGEAARAIAILERHKRLDPFYVPMAILWLGLAHYMLKHYSQAIPILRECVSRAPDLRHGHAWLAAACAQLGQINEARAATAEALRIDPNYKINAVPPFPFKHSEDAQHYFEGLRKAGVPE